MSSEIIRLEIERSIATLSIDRSKALNALNRQAIAEITRALEQVRADPSLRVLIITGSGPKAFVAGADIHEMAGYTPIEALAFAEDGHRMCAALEELSIPTLAAVNGYALGGGLELALACDLIYASEKARFGLPEVGLGVIPGFGGTQRLVRVIGRQRARELVYTGEVIDASRAHAMGLVVEVLAPEALLPRCHEVAGQIATRAPLAVARAKRVIAAGSECDLERANELERQVFAGLFGSADQREGMQAFVEKRPPVFQGK